MNVSTDIFIQRPLAEVWKYAANPDNVPAWFANIRGVEWKTQPPLAEGSRVAFDAHFLGRRLAYTYEVVELLPGRRLRMRTRGRSRWRRHTPGKRPQMAVLG